MARSTKESEAAILEASFKLFHKFLVAEESFNANLSPNMKLPLNTQWTGSEMVRHHLG